MAVPDEKAWKEFFDEMDIDKSGSIEKGEIKTLFKKLDIDDAVASQVEKDIMEECDQNADGKISWDEFSRALKKNTCK